MNKIMFAKKQLLLLLSIGLFICIVQGENQDYCSGKYSTPYYNYIKMECVEKSGCVKDPKNPTKEVFLSTNTFTCATSTTYCKDYIYVQPGFQKLAKNPSVDYIECTQCPITKPNAINNQADCGFCPDNQVFSYLLIDSSKQTNCFSADSIYNASPSSINGVFDPDMKIYYAKLDKCPENSIKSSFTVKVNYVDRKFAKCEWCPLEKTESKDGITCNACADGYIPDQESHSCILPASCTNILSSDEKICYKSTCPQGQYIASTDGKKKCSMCGEKTYPSKDQSKCVSNCSENSEVLHEASQSCILTESCDGYYQEGDQTICLKNSCQREKATVDKPASIVLPKANGKTYQVCQSCPSLKPFAYLYFENQPLQECKNCKSDYQMISDYVLGVCSNTDNFKAQGILIEDQTELRATYECKKGYYQMPKKNKYTKYMQCMKCPSHKPISQGLSCSNQCPDGEIADSFTNACVKSEGFECQGKLSSDGKLCSDVCKPGDFITKNDEGTKDICKPCEAEKPLSSIDFKSCVAQDCFFDVENEVCFADKDGCGTKGKDYFYQLDSKNCKLGCPDDQLESYNQSNWTNICINKCKPEQYLYYDGFFSYCLDKCKEYQYVIEDQKLCKNYSDCKTFISGTTTKICADKCAENEIQTDADSNPYIICKLLSECTAVIMENPDKSLVCSNKCVTYKNMDDKKCIDKCPDNYYATQIKPTGTYFECYKACPKPYVSLITNEGSKQCVYPNGCNQFINQAYTSCESSCQKDEIAVKNSTNYYECKPSTYQCQQKQYTYKDFKICSPYCYHFLVGGSQCAEKCPDTEKYAMKKDNQSQTFQNCSNSCEMMSFVDSNGILQCSDVCSLYLSPDKKSCLQNCESGQYIYEKKQSETYTQCGDSCSLIKYTDDKGIKYCNSTCSLYLSADKLTCASSCLNGEFLNEKLVGQNYYQCTTTCPNGQFEFTDDKNVKRCVKECKQYISSNKKQCNSSCLAEFVKDKPDGQLFTECLDTCPDISFTGDDGIKRCTKTCPFYLSADKTQCNKSCLNDEFVNDKENNQSHFQCTTSCTEGKFESLDDKGVKSCIKECKLFISTDKKQCNKSCQPKDFVIDRPEGQEFTVCAEKCADIQYDNGDEIKRCAKTCPFYLSVDQTSCNKSCGQEEYVNEKEKGETYFQCSKSCAEGKFEFIDDKKTKNCIKECKLFISTDKKSCSKSCKSIDFVLDRPEGQEFTECAEKCADIQYDNGDEIKRCAKTCPFYLSVDKTSCNKSCGQEEYVNEKEKGETYFQCSKSCADGKFEFIDDKKTKNCIKECNKYVSADNKSCVKSCNPDEFVNDQVEGKTYLQCSTICPEGKFGFTDKSGVKKCSSTCPLSLSSDKKECLKECKEGEFTKDKVESEAFYQCSTDCEGFEYYLVDKIKRCGKSCPAKQFESLPEKKCLSSKEECKTVISSNNKQCIESCDAQNIEFAKQMNGFKQCFVCRGYYNEKFQTCATECQSNEIGVPSQKKCFSLEEGKKYCNDNGLRLSSDGKKCTAQCQYPDITNSKGNCKKPCDANDTSCQQCDEGELTYVEGAKIQCTSECPFKISSDNKKCLQNCAIIREKEPLEGTQNCIKCSDEEVPVFIENFITCKSKNSENILNDKLDSVKSYIQKPIGSKDQVDEIKKQVTEVAKDIFAKVSEQKDKPAKELIQQVAALALEFIQNLQITELNDVAQSIGSKETIITQAQKKKEGYKFKDSFNMDTISGNSNVSLMEENLTANDESLLAIATSVIAKNPACNSDACKAYPLFQLDKVEDQIAGRRMLQTDREFSVTFNINDTKNINKYICLSYDLSDPTSKPTKTTTTIGQDKQSVSCLVNGNVSVLLDSQCIYVDKSLCVVVDNKNKPMTEEEDDDDELNGGEIAGIVIGVLAFVGIVALVIVHIIRAQKQTSTKLIKKYEQTVTENPENGQAQTLGILTTERKI